MLCAVCLNKLMGLLFPIVVFVIPAIILILACGIYEDRCKAQEFAERRRAERRARNC